MSVEDAQVWAASEDVKWVTQTWEETKEQAEAEAAQAKALPTVAKAAGKRARPPATPPPTATVVAETLRQLQEVPAGASQINASGR